MFTNSIYTHIDTYTCVTRSRSYWTRIETLHIQLNTFPKTTSCLLTQNPFRSSSFHIQPLWPGIILERLKTSWNRHLSPKCSFSTFWSKEFPETPATFVFVLIKTSVHCHTVLCPLLLRGVKTCHVPFYPVTRGTVDVRNVESCVHTRVVGRSPQPSLRVCSSKFPSRFLCSRTVYSSIRVPGEDN